MTTQEFSAEFDVLYNNITSNLAPGLNEYEKSVFLTKAQSLLINEYFNPRIDSVGGGFDGGLKRQYDFSSLTLTDKLTCIDAANIDRVDKRSVVFEFPRDYYLSINEILSDSSYLYNVIPLNYAEYSRVMMKPYNFPVKRAVWRLFTKTVTKTDNQTNSTYAVPIAEIVGKPTMTAGEPKAYTVVNSQISYMLRYIKKPSPIILDDLSNYGIDLKIEGNSEVTQCELPEETHQEILERAVTLAKIAWQGSTPTQVASSRNNENN